MKFGAHLPLIDFDGDGWRPSDLDSYADAARELGFSAISANDHLVYQRPWLDGIVALSSVIGRTGDMTLATTVSLPVLRHPIALAKHAAAIDMLSGGRLVLGVGPGSSARDYEAVGIDFEERWRRLDEAVAVLRCHLSEEQTAYEGSYYPISPRLEPRPQHDVPIWIGSWGSQTGLRRVARLGDGWIASAYNTTPNELHTARANLDRELTTHGKNPATFPSALATMWTYVTESRAERQEKLMQLAAMVGRPSDELAEQVLIGPAKACAEKLQAYVDAGVELAFIWPLAEATQQLERFMTAVAPKIK